MKPKYFKDFRAVLAHIRHKEEEYIPVKAEKKVESETKKTAKKKSSKKKEK